MSPMTSRRVGAVATTAGMPGPHRRCRHLAASCTPSIDPWRPAPGTVGPYALRMLWNNGNPLSISVMLLRKAKGCIHAPVGM